MFFPAHLRVCLFLIAALLGTEALASNNCPLGETRCVSGAPASGGCFNPAVSRCYDGLICAASFAVCRRGSIGPGGCFRSDRFICDLGRLRFLSYYALHRNETDHAQYGRSPKKFRGPKTKYRNSRHRRSPTLTAAAGRHEHPRIRTSPFQ